jgi:ubiquitin carboxyl-terminal hydrolase 5/13
MTASRFVLGAGWVIEKLSKHSFDLDLNIHAPDMLNLDRFRGSGLQDDESLLPDDNTASNSTPNVDTEALNQLLAMGFPEVRCMKALMKTGNSGADNAMNWLFEHMEDPDIDDPIIPIDGGSGPDVSSLVDMGFTEQHARRAMKETV